MATTQQQRIVLGLKIRQFRQEKSWNFEDLRRETGISVSYLNEIEKGKKYPQSENLDKLANALGVTSAFLSSPELTKQYAPLGDLLQSNFLNELPLDLFGIDLQQIVEIIARAPDRVNAFISALLEIARNYSLREENFYFAALRAYQELRMNYFEEIEAEAEHFVKKHNIPNTGSVPAAMLETLLKTEFNYKIDLKGLDKYPELGPLRSVFSPRKKQLLMHGQLNERQQAFQLAKEIGFNVLQLKERSYASSLVKINSFEEVLNNYKAAYFAVSLLINKKEFVKDLGQFFGQTTFNADFLQKLMGKYQASPEVFFQRFNVLSKDFNLHKVFFLRFIHDLDRDAFDIDKELHLNRRHQPHATGLSEHYCRRWLSISLLKDLQSKQLTLANSTKLISGIQRASFWSNNEEYLCLAVAKAGYPVVNKNVSITIGVLLDENSKKVMKFWNDPKIPLKTVNITCERCSISPCIERGAEPHFIKKREQKKLMLDVLKKLTEK
jgi:XRE family transcriptional regulator, fatty acid utilization regulator